MPTTVELYGIKAEVPEGYPDFGLAKNGTVPVFYVMNALPPNAQGEYIDIKKLFASAGGRECPVWSPYWQRRVVEAAFKHFCDKSKALRDDDATALECFNAFQQAENWREIGEAAKEEASK